MRDIFTRAALPVAESFNTPYSDTGQAVAVIRLHSENNRTSGSITVSASLYPHQTPVHQEQIRLSSGFHDYQCRALANALSLPPAHWNEFIAIVHKAFACHLANDALSITLEPLVLTPAHLWVVEGGSVRIDTNARFRQPYGAPKMPSAVLGGVSFVPLSGCITCIVNGAGLGMLTLDSIARLGGTTAALIDMGSDGLLEKLSPALEHAASIPSTHAILINLFAGFTHCTDIAASILAWRRERPLPCPVIVRLAGFDAEEALDLIMLAALDGLFSVAESDQAAALAVQLTAQWAVG
ncbi:MAG: hypothetical protein SF162_14795 [bacterium]|nr:hypothetical protein [bacterium]